MRNLATKDWWTAAGTRALRSAIVIALPYIPASYTGVTPYVTIVSAAVIGIILSLLTSLAGIRETEGVAVPWWYAVTDRVIRTVSQALITAVGSAVLIQDVNWSVVPALVASAGLGSLLLGVLTNLPEAEHPVAQVSVLTEDPERVAREVPVVAVAGAPAETRPTEGAI